MAVEGRTVPNQSLYLQNLPEKLQKDDLRRELYMLFSTYGPVLDIVALKTKKMRGQAHVLFRDVHAATQAIRACQGFDFYGREMKISFAKSRSHAIAKMTGTFNPQETAKANAAQQSSGAPSLPAGVAPPSTLPRPPKDLPAPPKVNGEGLQAPTTGPIDAPSPQGIKRAREQSDDEDAPMDEDESEGEMEMSEDED